MNKTLRSIITFISSFIVIIALCFAVNQIPKTMVADNIQKSAIEIDNIDNSLIKNVIQTKMNNLVDLYALETVYYSENNIESIFLPKYNEIRPDDDTYVRTAVNMMEINSALDTYPNYAVGQNIFLRLLLIKFTLKQIKMFNLAFFFILSLLFILICEKQKLRSLWISFAIGIILSSSFLASVSLEYMPIILISLVTSIIILCTKNEMPNLFIILGVITAFFDNLGLGIILFSMPQLVSLIKYSSFETPELKHTIKHFLQWFISLSLTVVLKMGVTYFLCKEFSFNYIKDLFSTDTSLITSISSGLYKNISKLLPMVATNAPMANAIIFFIIIFLYMCFIYTYKTKNINNNKVLAFMVVGILPILNLVIFFGRSYNYSYYMYRILLVTIMSMGLIAFECTEFFKPKHKSSDLDF